MYPTEYLYSKEHEWVMTDEDICKVGITAYAQQELGEVVFVELPQVGDSFAAGDEVGTIESVKAVAEVYSPVGGEVVEINERLEEEPELVNSEPHGAGWLYKIRLADDGELGKLMNAEAYESFTKTDD